MGSPYCGGPQIAGSEFCLARSKVGLSRELEIASLAQAGLTSKESKSEAGSERISCVHSVAGRNLQTVWSRETRMMIIVTRIQKCPA